MECAGEADEDVPPELDEASFVVEDAYIHQLLGLEEENEGAGT